MTVADRIVELIKDKTEINRREVAAAVGMEDGDPAFRLSWQRARDYLLGEGIGFKSLGGGARYFRANAAQLLQMAHKDRRAAVKKLKRRDSKLTIVLAVEEDPHLLQMAKRAMEHGARLLAALRKR